MGDLIRIPHSELNSSVEVLARVGVTQEDFAKLRKAASYTQITIGRVLGMDSLLWALLEMGPMLEAIGFTEKDLRKLAKNEDKLRQILSFISGHAEIKPIEHLIDCDANPFIPNGLQVVEHKKTGQMKWDPNKVMFHLSKNQKNGKVIEGNKLRKELENMPVLNANVLDYLLANPHLIPEEWKGKYIFFWGTIYRSSGGDLHVRCLDWGGDGWCWYYLWLGDGWGGDDPAALLAS